MQGEGEVDRIGLSPQEMELMDSQQQTAREIAVALGPAPELLGDPENKVYNNVKEAREALYHEHAIPMARLIADEMTAWLLPKYDTPGELRVDIDVEGIEALQADPQEVRRQDLEELKAGAITINEYRARRGLDPVDGGDALLIPSSQVPLSTSMDDVPTASN
jgi:phage portal protein BeeE